MPQLSLFDPASLDATPILSSRPAHAAPAQDHRQPAADSSRSLSAGTSAPLAPPPALDGSGNRDRPRCVLPAPVASLEYVAYVPLAAGDGIAQTVLVALASFRERRGTEPAHVAVHPDDVAALAGVIALPILGQSACLRGQVRLALG